jgi:hypothetical protein
MSAWLARWRARWRTLREGAWLAGMAAGAQWALVATAVLVTAAHTVGYLARIDGPGRVLQDMGAIATAAWLTSVLAAAAALLVLTPVTWWLVWASLRRAGTDLDGGHATRRGVWRRVWWLAAGLLVPPILGALVSGERALAVAPLFALAEVPLAALALWVFGAYLLLGYWMRRICFRVGVAGVVIYLLVRRFELLPRWMAEWPRAGGSLALSPAEAAYIETFTGIVMVLGFVVLGSMMLAARPLMAPGPVVLTPPPMPLPPAPMPSPAPPPPLARQPEPVREVELPRHPSGRVMRRLDV